MKHEIAWIWLRHTALSHALGFEFWGKTVLVFNLFEEGLKCSLFFKRNSAEPILDQMKIDREKYDTF